MGPGFSTGRVRETCVAGVATRLVVHGHIAHMQEGTTWVLAAPVVVVALADGLAVVLEGRFPLAPLLALATVLRLLLLLPRIRPLPTLRLFALVLGTLAALLKVASLVLVALAPVARGPEREDWPRRLRAGRSHRPGSYAHPF